MPKYDKYRWKGKLVSGAVYKQRLSQSATGLANKIDSNIVEEKQAENKSEESCDYMSGRRIVEFSVLANQLWCSSCKEVLSLAHIEAEQRRGLGSILRVRCHKCLLLNIVTTGKQHALTHGNIRRFDVNSKAAIGVLHGGLGFTHLNKLLACLNIPTIDFKTYKRYEREVGPSVETIAKESCENATQLERDLTLQNVENIEKLLPSSLRSGFIIPNKPSTEPHPIPSTPIPSMTSTPTAAVQIPPTLSTEKTQRILQQSHENSFPTTFDDVVRVMVSYDMGWSRRGTGRNYDSLNGFGAIIGSMSGLVLDYSTRNRKCKKCDNGNPPSNHSCRLNFWGSAKAMEPDVAKDIVTASSVLISHNTEVGVLIGDDDSSTVAACRAASSHTIVKHSDMNHASGGVKSELFKIEKNYRELNKDGILYLHRCFTYATSQNKGNSAAMADAIACIPYHAFNDHSKCGPWCGYIQDKENYDHTIIPGGFHNQQLFEDLKGIFDKLASNAQTFSAGASSNANESLNNTMASKAPKSRCYSLSESADFRFACAIRQKNVGEAYTQKVAVSLGLSPGKFHSEHIARIQRIVEHRRSVIKTHEFKKKRMALKKLRSALRHRKEDLEGVTYKSNCALLNSPAVEDENPDNDGIDPTTDDTYPIVLLDLETSGFSRDCDILQIAAKSGTSTFESYVKPTQQISASATEANGLTSCYGDLMLHGRKVSSVPLRVAFGNFHHWLMSFDRKCYIATHNFSFDGPRFYDAINSCSLRDDFDEVIYGFLDTLHVIRRHTGRKGKGACTITGLAEWLNVSSVGAHNGSSDVEILHQILRKAKVTHNILVSDATTYSEQFERWDNDQRRI